MDPMTIAGYVVGGVTGTSLLLWYVRRRGLQTRHA